MMKAKRFFHRTLCAGFVVLALFLHRSPRSAAQSVVPIGGGSYASSIPPSNQFAGGFYSMTAQQVVDEYALLHFDNSLTNRPIPSNQWWTDLLIGDRSSQPTNGGPRIIKQDNFGGSLWAFPAVVEPGPSGLKLYFPNAWLPRTSTNSPNGSFNQGPPLDVTAVVPVPLTTNDTLIADFEGTSYPPGWVTTGTAFGTGPVPAGSWPNQSPPVKGFIGKACVNTYRGSDAPQGTLTSPTFTIARNYIHLLVGGGSASNTAVRLLLGTNIVMSASGGQSGTLSWNTWDVSSYVGQAVKIQIADQSSGGWGFILCDFIVASDDPSATNRFTDVFSPRQSTVTGWGDWHVAWRQQDAQGRSLATTLARGVPFVWTENVNLKPRIKVYAGTKLYNSVGGVITRTDGSTFTATMLAFDAQGRWWGLYAPDNTVFKTDGDYLEAQLSGAANYLVYGLLPARTNLAQFATYAYARVTGTAFSWDYQPTNGFVLTHWQLNTTPLKGTQTNTFQGWLPHSYRATKRDFSFLPLEYLTPRGVMKLAVGTRFDVTYDFRGLAPVLPAPRPLGLSNDFDPLRMTRYVTNFAKDHPGRVAETYSGGKDMGITAQYLSFARQLGLTNQLDRMRTNLTALMSNWFTYTPGETNFFFARYPNWRALIGFPPGYGSEAFNDNHLHYGYFTVAAALLGMEDTNFLAQCGPMARLVAKQYANWERNDPGFPFLRTFDVWEGHSWAGGFSTGGGNNQESSSEAMNSWVGLFLLGGVLNDHDMTAAGAMGYAIESSAVNEYWQDMYRTNLPASYGRGMVGVLSASSLAYGTYFSGDPAWVYGIQWVPANHWNNYLARDKSHAAWQLQQMWNERVLTGNVATNQTNVPSDFGDYLGNYILGYQSLFDSQGVAALMDDYWSRNLSIATASIYPGVTYYLAHALRDLGDQDLTSWTSVPTSQVYFNPNTRLRTYVIYNPAPTAQSTILFRNSLPVETVVVPAQKTAKLTRREAPSRVSIAPDWQIITNGLSLRIEGSPGAAYQLVASEDFVGWRKLADVLAGVDGLGFCVAPWAAPASHRFYRLLSEK